MERQSETKIVVITRRTRLVELLRRHNTLEQAKFYVESLGSDFSDYQQEDQTYRSALAQAEAALAKLGRVQLLDRDFLANFIFGPQDIVVVIGQDGLVANTLKYIPNRAVIAANPDPARFDGVLLPFSVKDLGVIVKQQLTGERPVQEITMAKARLSDGQEMTAVNDFFIGPARHSSAQYELHINGRSERQSSSGVIISTGLGSTGWLRSVLTGSLAVAQGMGFGRKPNNRTKVKQAKDGLPLLPWDAEELYFTVREPFPSNVTGTDLVFGKITRQSDFHMISAMPQEGVIFSDGQLDDVMNFHSGVTVRVARAEDRGILVV